MSKDEVSAADMIVDDVMRMDIHAHPRLRYASTPIATEAAILRAPLMYLNGFLAFG
jgi:hypothetical protein